MGPIFKGKEKEILDYEASKLDETWASERGFADQIMQYIHKRKLHFKLDDLTRGRGNCFMIAVLQQLKRGDIFGLLTPEMKTIASTIDHNGFRRLVKTYIDTSKEPIVIEMKKNYSLNYMAAAALGEEPLTWNHYWKKMLKDETWADQLFIQSSALFLKLDIGIVDIAGNENRPYYIIEGGGSQGMTIWVGLVTHIHYQSLLPDQPKNPVSVDNLEEDEDDEECPVCRKRFNLKGLNLHLGRNKKCRSNIKQKDMQEIKERAELKKREKNSQWRAKNK